MELANNFENIKDSIYNRGDDGTNNTYNNSDSSANTYNRSDGNAYNRSDGNAYSHSSTIATAIYTYDDIIIYNSRQLELGMYNIINYINDIVTIKKYNIGNIFHIYKHNKQLTQYKSIINAQVIYILYLISKVNKSLKSSNLITSSSYYVDHNNHNYDRLLLIIKMINYLENMLDVLVHDVSSSLRWCTSIKPVFIEPKRYLDVITHAC